MFSDKGVGGHHTCCCASRERLTLEPTQARTRSFRWSSSSPARGKTVARQDTGEAAMQARSLRAQPNRRHQVPGARHVARSEIHRGNAITGQYSMTGRGRHDPVHTQRAGQVAGCAPGHSWRRQTNEKRRTRRPHAKTCPKPRYATDRIHAVPGGSTRSQTSVPHARKHTLSLRSSPASLSCLSMRDTMCTASWSWRTSSPFCKKWARGSE